MEMVRHMANSVFGPDPVRGGTGDPTRKFYVGQPQQIFRENGYYVLSLALPLATREDVDLHRSVFDELIVRTGNWRRNRSISKRMPFSSATSIMFKAITAGSPNSSTWLTKYKLRSKLLASTMHNMACGVSTSSRRPCSIKTRRVVAAVVVQLNCCCWCSCCSTVAA